MAEEIKSQARKTLDAINALIEKRATSDHQSYAVGNGLSVTKMTIDELLKWKKFYEREVRLEVAAKEKAEGKRRKNKIQTRFV